MTQLIEGTRFTILLHAELNRLRRNRPLQQFYDVADALRRSAVSRLGVDGSSGVAHACPRGGVSAQCPALPQPQLRRARRTRPRL